MKKVLLINPPFLPRYSRDSRSPAVTRSGTLYYPIWLSYLASFLLKKGVKVHLIDGVTQNINWKQLTKLISDEKFDYIVVHTSTPSIENDASIAQDIKKSFTVGKVYLMGTHVSALPIETLEKFELLDGVIVGEPENALRDLINNKNNSEVRGLTYRDGGEIFRGKEPEPLKDLTELGWVSSVYRRFLNIQDYGYSALKHPVITIMAGRGCRFNCSFCVLPQVFSGHIERRRPIKDILDELEYIGSEMPWVKEVMFEDDTFTSDPEWIIDFCVGLLRRGIKLSWSANARADLPAKSFSIMRAAGLRLLFTGFESPNRETLIRINKQLSIDEQFQFMHNAKLAGVLVHGGFILGFPDEDINDMLGTIDHAIKLDPDTAQFFPLIPYPGTPIYQELNEKGYLQFNSFRDYLTEEGFHDTVLDHPYMPKREILELCKLARIKFYKRPGYILKKMFQILKHPSEAPRIIKAFLRFRKAI